MKPPNWSAIRCPRGGRPAFSLMEIMVSTAVLGILAAFTVPRFMVAVEVSKADIALANLRTLWTAERFYHAQYRGPIRRGELPVYADMASLLQLELIDASLFAASDAQSPAALPYAYSVGVDPRNGRWVAFATRNGAVSASGGFSIDLESGESIGDTVRYGNATLVPNPSTWLTRAVMDGHEGP